MSREQAMKPPSFDNGGEPPIQTKSGIYGLILSFTVLAWIAVSLRIYARLRPVRCLYWDDLFVVLAAIAAALGAAGVIQEATNGLGSHFKTVTGEQWNNFLFWTYFANPTHAAALCFIKISVLIQYLRLCTSHGYRKFRMACWAMIVICSLWGMAYFFLMVFGCSPVSAFWKQEIAGKCILYGSRDPSEKLKGYLSHAATNMALDLVIFCLPLHFFYSLDMQRKSKWGIVALFVFAAMIWVVAIARLAVVLRHGIGLRFPDFDATYYASPVIILSSLEITVATLAASVPIFWPAMVDLKNNAILIVSEISIKSEQRVQRIDSADALHDEWQPLGDYRSVKDNLWEEEGRKSDGEGRIRKAPDAYISTNAVLPWEGRTSRDTLPALNVVETTVEAPGARGRP